MPEYIERKALVRKLRAEADKCKIEEGDTLAGLYLANCIVDDLPAADVEPVRHGRWKTHLGWGFMWRCSCCKYKLCHTPWMKISHNYCPNCGAKMDGEGPCDVT